MWLIIHPVLKSSQESLTYIYWMAVQLAVHHIQWPRCGRGFCLWEVQHCPWPAGQPIYGKGAGWHIFILPCGPSQLLDLKDSLWVPATQRLHREGTSCQIFPAVVIEGKDQGVWPESELASLSVSRGLTTVMSRSVSLPSVQCAIRTSAGLTCVSGRRTISSF